jgi:ketosteroid isomerase-like protein
MYDLDQLRRNVAIMDLLTASYEAWSRGDKAESDARITEALDVDADVVSILRGGMLTGEVPQPGEDPQAWTAYVSDAQEKLALAEGEAAYAAPGDSEHCVTCGDERHGRCGTQWTAEGRHAEHRCHLAEGHAGGCECCCGARRLAGGGHG